MLLKLEGVTKKFQGLTAVSDVSFEIEKNEIVGIFGPNGSGKSTTLNLVSGIIAPTSGRILWEGRDICGEKTFRIAQSGLVKAFQNPQLFRELTVVEHIKIASHLRLKRELGWRRVRTLLSAHGAKGQIGDVEKRISIRMEEVLGLCQLEDLREERADALSYGGEKMLGVAMCLMADPKLLLLDEPASGLGHDEILNLEKILLGLREHGVTLCVIDHQVGFLGRLSDRCIALAQGKKIADGTPAEVLAHDAVRFAYLGEKNA